MAKQPPTLLSIEPKMDHGVYSAKVKVEDKEYIFQVTVNERGAIPVVWGEKNLFAVLSLDIKSYTNVLKAVGLRHGNEELVLPLNLQTMQPIV